MTDLQQNGHKAKQFSMKAIQYELHSASGNANDKIYLRTADGTLLEVCGVGLSLPAAFNEDSGGYEAFVKITSARPFFVKPVDKRRSSLAWTVLTVSSHK